MTTATVAPPSGNAYAVLLALFTVTMFVTFVVLWVHEKRWDRHGDLLDEHAEQLALLAGRIQSLADFLDVEITDPVDDSPEAMARPCMCGKPETDSVHHRPQVSEEEHAYEPAPTEAEYYGDARPDNDTDQFPAAPPTVPDGLPLAVQSALLRPSPVPRGKSAEWVEDAIEAMRVRNAERMARRVPITEEAS